MIRTQIHYMTNIDEDGGFDIDYAQSDPPVDWPEGQNTHDDISDAANALHPLSIAHDIDVDGARIARCLLSGDRYADVEFIPDA